MSTPRPPTAHQLSCRAARLFLATHPGSTFEEMKKSMGSELKNGVVSRLQRLKLIRFEGGGKKGSARWFVAPQ